VKNRGGGRDVRGPKNPRWRGGSWIHSKGYLMLWSPGHPACNCRNYAPAHIKAYYDFHGHLPGEYPDQDRLDAYIEQTGKFPSEQIDVHHHDGDKFHNDPSNLEPLEQGEHQSKGHPSNGGVHGKKHRLVKGSPRAREIGRKGGRAAARKRRQSAKPKRQRKAA
jgi:hypothetical protein